MASSATMPASVMAEEIANLMRYASPEPIHDFHPTGQARIRFEDGYARLSCANKGPISKWQYETATPAEINGEPFTVAVCARRLLAMLHRQYGQIEVAHKGKLVEFKLSSGLSFSLSNNNAGPVSQHLYSESRTIEVSSDHLMRSLKGVKVVCGKNDGGRFIFDHIMIDHQDGNLNLVATDSHRLAIHTFSTESEESFERAIPKQCADALVHSLDWGVDKGARISPTTNGLLISSGRWKVHVNGLGHERTPDWRQLPETSSRGSKSATVDRDALLSAVGRVDQFTSGRNTHRYAILGVEEGQLCVKAKVWAESISSNELMRQNIVECEHDLDDMAFQIEYLLDGIESTDTNRLEIFFGGQTKPTVLEFGSFSYLIMPVRI